MKKPGDCTIIKSVTENQRRLLERRKILPSKMPGSLAFPQPFSPWGLSSSLPDSHLLLASDLTVVTSHFGVHLAKAHENLVFFWGGGARVSGQGTGRSSWVLPALVLLPPPPRGHLLPNLLPVPPASVAAASTARNPGERFLKPSPGH